MKHWFVVAPALLSAVIVGFGPRHALAQPNNSAAQDQTRVDRGRRLMAQYQCGSCHTIPEVPAARGDVAQTLVSWSRRSYIAGRLPNRPDTLAQWIVAPQALVPGTPMPSMGVSPADAQAMAAFLFSLE